MIPIWRAAAVIVSALVLSSACGLAPDGPGAEGTETSGIGGIGSDEAAGTSTTSSTALLPDTSLAGTPSDASGPDASGPDASGSGEAGSVDTRAESVDLGDVPDFGVTTIRVGDEQLLVAVADLPDERIRGLQEVAGMGSLDGMIFVLPTTQPVTFTMKNTLIPLDLGLFDGNGILVEVIEMIPCAATSGSCPSYPGSQPVRWAIEVDAGRMSGMPLGSILTFTE